MANPQPREWPPLDLLSHTNELRRLISADKQLYDELGPKIAADDGNAWAILGEAIKTRSRYYRGEILRAKRDTQRYILGEEPRKPSNFGKLQCEWLTTYIEDLQSELDSGDPTLIYMTKKSIAEITQQLMRITYGG